MKEKADPFCASDGVGPLFQRDYSAVIAGSSMSPEQVGKLLRERFVEFCPPETARFDRPDRSTDQLEPGDEIDICIALAGRCQVRVIHADEHSLTLRTLRGHPEAGRISFGARHDDRGRLEFRIRSRARSSGLLPYLGFHVLGKQMQARCWIRFIQRVAEACGGRIEGRIRVKTRRVDEEPSDQLGGDVPTFA